MAGSGRVRRSAFGVRRQAQRPPKKKAAVAYTGGLPQAGWGRGMLPQDGLAGWGGRMLAKNVLVSEYQPAGIPAKKLFVAMAIPSLIIGCTLAVGYGMSMFRPREQKPR